MAPRPPTFAELAGSLALAAAFCFSTYLAWRAGAYLALLVMVPLALLFVWGVADMLRQGVRQPTPFERFESRRFFGVILLVFGGGAAVALLQWAGYQGAALTVLAIVLAASLYGASKLRGRGETSAGYKRRVGYREPEQQQQAERGKQ